MFNKRISILIDIFIDILIYSKRILAVQWWLNYLHLSQTNTNFNYV